MQNKRTIFHGAHHMSDSLFLIEKSNTHLGDSVAFTFANHSLYIYFNLFQRFFLLIFWFESEIIVHIELFPIDNDFYELVCNKWKSDTFTMELWTELIYFILINTESFSGKSFMPNFSGISPKIPNPKYKHQWIMRWSRSISNWIYQNVIT